MRNENALCWTFDKDSAVGKEEIAVRRLEIALDEDLGAIPAAEYFGQIYNGRHRN
ncbi:hypothetical protein D3C85_1760580 [compost metagenome]